jgi:hypothetical protein
VPDIVINSSSLLEAAQCCEPVSVIQIDMSPYSAIALFISAFCIVWLRGPRPRPRDDMA